MKNKNKIPKYVYLTSIYLAIFLIILSTFFLQIFKLSLHGKISENLEYKAVIKAKRGSIITSDNLEIAQDLEFQNFIIDPTLFANDEEINKFIEILSKVIPELDTIEVKNKIIEKRIKKNKYYPFEKTLITIDQREKIEELIRNEKKRKKGFFKGRFISFNRVFERKYIDNSVFESLIGFLNREGEGVYGLEHKYQDYLKGIDGIVSGIRPFTPSVAEYTLPYLLDQKVVKKDEPGKNLLLSINSIFQYALDDVLKNAYEAYTPVSAMGIIMETDTGRILAMDSYPKASNKAEIKNYNITSLFEPGSIFKPITVASAIDDGKINENTQISSSGKIKIKNRTINDHDNTTIGTMSVSKIMAHSGNVGLVKISQMMDPTVFYNYLVKFGLGNKTGIDTSFETSAKMMTTKQFTEVRRSNVSFGQGINMTQLQILTALNATVNGGNLIQPRLVDKIVDKEGNVIKEYTPTIKSKVVSEDTSRRIREILEKVVSEGTGQGIKLEGYRLGGKTGTAQKAGPNGYETGKYFSSFFTFFPVDNPKYSILVTVDEPHGAYYGASVALPMVRDVLDKVIKYENILPNSNDIDNQHLLKEEGTIIKDNNNNNIAKLNEAISINLMPNLKGLTRKNIIKLTLEGYKVEIKGHGRVVAQYPETGKVIKKGDLIKLELQ